MEKGTATHSGILAWRIPWTVEPGRHSPLGHKESDITEPLTLWSGWGISKNVRKPASQLASL